MSTPLLSVEVGPARLEVVVADITTLAVDAQLTNKAQAWAKTMADKGDIWHSNLPDGITENWQRLGENVGMGGSVDALHDAFVKVLNRPDVRDRIVADGSEPAGTTPEEFRLFMLADLAKWAKLVKESGAKLD